MSEGNVNYRRPSSAFQPPKKKGFNKLLLLIPVVLLVFLLLVGGVGYAVYRFVLNAEPEQETEVFEQPSTISMSEGIRLLDGLELSLSGIQDVEQRVDHDGTSEQEELFTRRVIALKHIYTEAFLVDNHRLQSLNNVYMLHATEFSEQQVAVLRWFFALPPADRQQWEYVQGPVENFVDFRQKVEAAIANKNQIY